MKGDCFLLIKDICMQFDFGQKQQQQPMLLLFLFVFAGVNGLTQTCSLVLYCF